MIRSGNLQEYDYGVAKNMIHYGQTTPPLYDLGNIKAKIHLWYSDTDWVATQPDIEQWLLQVLPAESIIVSVGCESRWKHSDARGEQ